MITNPDALKAEICGGVGKPTPHESAVQHVTGRALYIDDRHAFAEQLYLYPIISDTAHGILRTLDTEACEQSAGVVRVITASDIPGKTDIGAVLPGDPLLIGLGEPVEYLGQVLAVVAADSLASARHGASLAKVVIEPLTAVLDVEQAMAQQHFVLPPHTHSRGNAVQAHQRAEVIIEGQLQIGGQEHFYLETQISMAVPGENGEMLLLCSTQHPSETQKLVAEVLDLPMSKVVIDTRRMGGGFGGKESQAGQPACLCALASHLTGRAAKMRLPRSMDMQITGKRHPFLVRYKVGAKRDGELSGVEIDLIADCGFSPDLSNSIVDRAMFHADNAYYLGDARITGYRCKTHKASNTAFRGFGGPQGVLAIENIIDHLARELGMEPLALRQRNYYRPGADITHYYQQVEGNWLGTMTEQLIASCNYQQRREQIIRFNRQNHFHKRGLALTPVKFGISFTASFLNQAGALIHIYTDGSIQLNHGGTEMGQGLNTKVAQIVAETFQVDLERIQITATRTDKVPNTSPTAASSGADLNGKAAQNAAQILVDRLKAFAAEHYHATEQSVRFSNNRVYFGDFAEAPSVSFSELVEQAYLGQVSLSASGFYKTPTIFYDREAARGRPFYYYALGVACSEVEIDTTTGEYRLLRSDLLHDVGASLNPAIDIGQVEGGFMQGVGWLTCEQLAWSEQGKLTSNSPASYKIPTLGDMPREFNVQLLENRRNPADTVYHSKAVGEPPFMLGISVWCAIKDAVASIGNYQSQPILDAPATPEAVLKAVCALKNAELSDE